MNSAKRRRLDANASTLRKPFRSPLKVSRGGQTIDRPDATDNFEQQTSGSITPFSSTTKEFHTSCSPSKPSPAIESCTLIDDVNTLQKQYSALTQVLRKLRQDLDVAEQARTLHSTSQGKQLKCVTAKWRNHARSAADQVFEFSRERVKEMGGIKTWQQSTQESSPSWLDRETSRSKDCHYQDDRDEIDEHSCKALSTRGKETDEDDEEQPEQVFTMSTMLQQMNVDPDLLGYDDSNEQWID